MLFSSAILAYNSENIWRVVGISLPVKPQLCLLGDKSVLPNIAKNEFTLIKIGCITAARMILRNWKCPKTPDLKDWIDGMIEIASYECMLGRFFGSI